VAASPAGLLPPPLPGRKGALPPGQGGDNILTKHKSDLDSREIFGLVFVIEIGACARRRACVRQGISTTVSIRCIVSESDWRVTGLGTSLFDTCPLLHLLNTRHRTKTCEWPNELRDAETDKYISGIKINTKIFYSLFVGLGASAANDDER
jgi:hypothetical protein